MEERKDKRGGARPGAGRKAELTDGGATETVRVRLTPQQKHKAEKLGNGNISAGVRAALEGHKKKT